MSQFGGGSAAPRRSRRNRAPDAGRSGAQLGAGDAPRTATIVPVGPDAAGNPLETLRNVAGLARAFSQNRELQADIEETAQRADAADVIRTGLPGLRTQILSGEFLPDGEDEDIDGFVERAVDRLTEGQGELSEFQRKIVRQQISGAVAQDVQSVAIRQQNQRIAAMEQTAMLNAESAQDPADLDASVRSLASTGQDEGAVRTRLTIRALEAAVRAGDPDRVRRLAAGLSQSDSVNVDGLIAQAEAQQNIENDRYMRKFGEDTYGVIRTIQDAEIAREVLENARDNGGVKDQYLLQSISHVERLEADQQAADAKQRIEQLGSYLGDIFDSPSANMDEVRTTVSDLIGEDFTVEQADAAIIREWSSRADLAAAQGDVDTATSLEAWAKANYQGREDVLADAARYVTRAALTDGSRSQAQTRRSMQESYDRTYAAQALDAFAPQQILPVATDIGIKSNREAANRVYDEVQRQLNAQVEQGEITAAESGNALFLAESRLVRHNPEFVPARWRNAFLSLENIDGTEGAEAISDTQVAALEFYNTLMSSRDIPHDRVEAAFPEGSRVPHILKLASLMQQGEPLRLPDERERIEFAIRYTGFNFFAPEENTGPSVGGADPRDALARATRAFDAGKTTPSSFVSRDDVDARFDELGITHADDVVGFREAFHEYVVQYSRPGITPKQALDAATMAVTRDYRIIDGRPVYRASRMPAGMETIGFGLKRYYLDQYKDFADQEDLDFNSLAVSGDPREGVLYLVNRRTGLEVLRSPRLPFSDASSLFGRLAENNALRSQMDAEAQLRAMDVLEHQAARRVMQPRRDRGSIVDPNHDILLATLRPRGVSVPALPTESEADLGDISATQPFRPAPDASATLREILEWARTHDANPFYAERPDVNALMGETPPFLAPGALGGRGG